MFFRHALVDGGRKAGGILWYVGGWTSRCCGSGSGESIGEKRVDEEVLWLFIASFLIIEFEKISVWGVKSWYNDARQLKQNVESIHIRTYSVLWDMVW